METKIAEIADGIYRLSTFVPDIAPPAGFIYNQFLVLGDERAATDLVRALVLCDTAHKIGTAELWDARIAAVERDGIESIADNVMERWFTPAFRRPENTAYHGYWNMLVRQPAVGYAATCAAIRDADFTEAAARIKVPTLCVVGDQDGSTPPDVVLATAKLIPRARYEVIAGAGHIPCVEQPEALAAILRAFIEPLTNGE